VGRKGGKARGKKRGCAGGRPEEAEEEAAVAQSRSASPRRRIALPQSPVAGRPAAAQREVREGVRRLARVPLAATQFTVVGRPLSVAVSLGGKKEPGAESRRRCVEEKRGRERLGSAEEEEEEKEEEAEPSERARAEKERRAENAGAQRGRRGESQGRGAELLLLLLMLLLLKSLLLSLLWRREKEISRSSAQEGNCDVLSSLEALPAVSSVEKPKKAPPTP